MIIWHKNVICAKYNNKDRENGKEQILNQLPSSQAGLW